ncbi:beta-ketoacyl synthase N-terminal-like domain-containing protein [Plantactinospora sp. B24E8]|uniref:beta-ketoacyl synthase N-terminal-like domain-containing protein n=1 Tax=Plantactinospora sp. B24E8 TaxID=3153567 RepID=UPI00325F8130
MDVVVSGLAAVGVGLDSVADLLAGTPGGGRPATGGAGPDTTPDGGAPDGTARPADPTRRLSGRGMRYKDRATKLALLAGRDALTDAGLLADDLLTVPGESVGVVVSTNYGNVDTVCEAVATIAEHTYLGTSPMALPATSSNVTASWLAITHGLRGANLTLCNGATSGLDAVFWAGLLIRSGRIRAALVVGVEPVNDPVRYVVGGGDPAARPRLLDGAAAVVLESADAVRERGGTPRAALGPYARRAEPAAAVAAVRAVESRPVGLWYPPGPAPVPNTGAIPHAGDGPATPDGPVCAGVRPDEGAPAARVDDLTRRFGECSGALGVLQCAAGAAWLADHPTEAVLATAGTGDRGGEDAAAALILTPAGTP